MAEKKKDTSINSAVINNTFVEEPKESLVDGLLGKAKDAAAGLLPDESTLTGKLVGKASSAIFGTNPKEKKDDPKDIFMHKTFQEAGMGSFDFTNSDIFRGHDKFHTSGVDADSLRKGFTFFTRPRLCLQNENIQNIEELCALWTEDPSDMRFGVKCMLDTKYCNDFAFGNRASLVDVRNPFNTLLGNCAIGVSGFTDQVAETKNSPTGFAGEDQVYLWGHDYLNKSHDLTVNVRDARGGPMKAWLQAYNLFNFLAADGKVGIYPEDSEQFRLFYTFSIYRFVTDASFRYIEHYAKATGCFVHVLNSGEWFNYSESDDHLSTAGEFSIPIKANHLAYDEPWILEQFNRLVEKYHDVASDTPIALKQPLPMDAINNYNGIPYICNSGDYTNGFGDPLIKGARPDKGRLMMTFRESLPTEHKEEKKSVGSLFNKFLGGI